MSGAEDTRTAADDPWTRWNRWSGAWPTSSWPAGAGRAARPGGVRGPAPGGRRPDPSGSRGFAVWPVGSRRTGAGARRRRARTARGSGRLPDRAGGGPGRDGGGVRGRADSACGRRVALKVLPFAAVMDPRHLQRFKNEALAAAEPGPPERGQGVRGRVRARGPLHRHAVRRRPHPGRPDPRAPGRRARPAGGGRTRPRSSAAAAGIRRTATPAGRRPTAHGRGGRRVLPPGGGVGHAGGRGAGARPRAGRGPPGRQAGRTCWWTGGASCAWPTSGWPSCATDPGVTGTGDLLGTLRYMSPEQAAAKHDLVDHRSDVYSLGATLYELLTLTPAFDGADRQAVLTEVTLGRPGRPAALDRRIPRDLETVVLKAMDKDPARRYQTAGEFADDLRRFLADEPVRAKRPTLRERAIRWASRRPRTVAAAVVLLVLGLGALAYWDRDRARAEATAFQLTEQAQGLMLQRRLPEAEATARRAADALPRFGGDRELRRRVGEMVADLALLRRLDDARLERVNVRPDGRKRDAAASSAQFAAAFREEYGVDVLAGDETAVLAEFGATGRPRRVGRGSGRLGVRHNQPGRVGAAGAPGGRVGPGHRCRRAGATVGRSRGRRRTPPAGPGRQVRSAPAGGLRPPRARPAGRVFGRGGGGAVEGRAPPLPGRPLGECHPRVHALRDGAGPCGRGGPVLHRGAGPATRFSGHPHRTWRKPLGPRAA